MNSYNLSTSNKSSATNSSKYVQILSMVDITDLEGSQVSEILRKGGQSLNVQTKNKKTKKLMET